MDIYRDEEADGRRRSRLIIAAVAAGAVLLIVAAGIVFANADGNVLRRMFAGESTPQGIAADIDRRPEMRGFMRAFARAYPSEHAAFLARLAEVYNGQGAVAADREAFLFMRNFMVAKSEAIASAPDSDLVAIARVNFDVVRALSDTDTRLCAEYVMRGFSYGASPAPSVVERLGNLSRLQIRAAAAGESPRRVERGPLTDTDYQAWVDEMAAHDPRLTRMVEDGSIAAAGPAEQCAAGLILYRAAAELPEATAARVNAHLVRNAAEMARQAL